MENYQLDKMDEVILRMLSENARVPFLERNSTQIGYETCAYIGLYLKEDVPFDKAIEALEQIPEVVECHCTNEPFDFFIKVHARNNDHLLTIIHEKLKPVGLSHSKIILSFRQIIKKQLTVLPIEGKENVT